MTQTAFHQPIHAAVRAAIWMVVLGGVTGFAGCRNVRKAPENPHVEVAAVWPEEAEEAASSSQDSLLIAYSRTHCFGMCPVFDCLIYESGYALYRGINFVDFIGYYHTQFDRTALQKILHVAEEIGYFGMEDEYNNQYITDLPSIITTIRTDNGFKRILNRYEGPSMLAKLYSELDQLLAPVEWNRFEGVPAPWIQE